MQQENKILEGNILIAKFMGAVNSTKDNDRRMLRFEKPHAGTNAYAFYPLALKYDTSFDWLMPCFKKFNDMVVSGKIEHDMESSAIHDCLEIAIMQVNIIAAHNYLTQLIQWYNTTLTSK